MRKTAVVSPPYPEGVVRLMIYQDENGVYLFGYDTQEDSGGLWDEWYESVADAEAASWEAYGVRGEAWQVIDDPLADCQHDWIAPVRIPRDKNDYPTGQPEKLVDGIWRPLQS